MLPNPSPPRPIPRSHRSWRFVASLAVLALVAPAPSALGADDLDDGLAVVAGLLAPAPQERRAARDALVERDDPSLVPAVVDVFYFLPRLGRRDALEVLEALTGTDEPGGSYWEWVKLVGGNEPTYRPPPGYTAFKGRLFSRIDPRYQAILYADAPSTIRLEEIVHGGVGLEGIPSIDDPTMIGADDAGYLKGDEEVFGVSLGGEHRAYPLRFLDWHEMLNDRAGDRPFTLSYCTLCGSGILYDTRSDDYGAFRFGTSGLLYRSNKLMVDRQTYSLWSNLLGEPVVGRSVGDAKALPVLPLVRTSWDAWREAHPDTLVMALDDSLKWHPDVVYRPGKADDRRRGVHFPVWKRSELLHPETEVFALRLGAAVKAYPLDTVLAEGLVHDVVGDVPVVLVADDGGGIRAYRRAADETFTRDGSELTLGDRRYRLTDDALVPADGADDVVRDRLPAHLANWKGWFAFFPRSEVYGVAVGD